MSHFSKFPSTFSQNDQNAYGYGKIPAAAGGANFLWGALIFGQKYLGVPPFIPIMGYYPGVVPYTIHAHRVGGYAPALKWPTSELRHTYRSRTILPPVMIEAKENDQKPEIWANLGLEYPNFGKTIFF